MDIRERFYQASVDEMKTGYVFEAEHDRYYCLICGEMHENGEIFHHEASGRFFIAEKFMALHVQNEHGSMLDYLLELDKKAIGLTDLQKLLVRGFASNVADTDLMKIAGIGSASTIRNHRHVLKEKKKQAKLLLAVLELMENGVKGENDFMPIHETATMVDERYALTEKEYRSILKTYFPDGLDGAMSTFPKKEKRKIAVLRHIVSRLDESRTYSEKELNTFLKGVWEEDYVVLRRYLIEYGFMDRLDDGSSYWVKKQSEEGMSSLDSEDVKNSADKGQDNEQDVTTTKASKKSKNNSTGSRTKLTKDEGKMDKNQRKQLIMEYQDKERSMGIFQIKNEANGKLYIGSSTNLDSLWGREQFILNMGTHKNHMLQKEWQQYGSENFSYLVLETVKFDQKIKYDYKDVLQSEQQDSRQVIQHYNKEVAKLLEKWLDKLQPYDEKGYHSTPKNS